MHNDQISCTATMSTPNISTARASSMARQELEAAIARIWGDVLGLDEVDVDDNFLLLGGESLLATQVVSEIRGRLGCDVSIRSIFVGTVAEVAAELAAPAPQLVGVGAAATGAASATATAIATA